MVEILEHPYVDWLLTFIAAALLTYTIPTIYIISIQITFIFWTLLLLLISIPIHYIFNTPTNTNYYLGISSPPNR